MQDKSFSSSKSAFTLIELLVVIGIIGILAGVMLGFFSGTTDAARATECMNNMRALAQAVNSYAAQDLEVLPHVLQIGACVRDGFRLRSVVLREEVAFHALFA